MSRLAFITLLSIIILIIALGFQYRQQSEKIELAIKAPTSSEPDYYLTNTHSTEFNDQGAIRYYFVASKLEFFPKGNYTLVDDPDVTLYHINGTPWYASAKQGRFTDVNETIKLWDDVWLRRGTPLEPLDLKTRALNLMPKQNLVQTDQDVVITNNTVRIEATGLKADINENRIELLSNVRVRHEPVKSH